MTYFIIGSKNEKFIKIMSDFIGSENIIDDISENISQKKTKQKIPPNNTIRVEEFSNHILVSGKRLEKPFYLRDVIALVDKDSSTIDTIKFGELRLIPTKRSLSVNSEKIILTEKESQLLNLLIKNSDRIIAEKEILSEIWGHNSDLQTNVLQSCVSRLRAKISEIKSSEKIENIETGYRIIK